LSSHYFSAVVKPAGVRVELCLSSVPLGTVGVDFLAPGKQIQHDYRRVTTLVEKHLGIIPVKFGQNPMSGFREEVV